MNHARPGHLHTVCKKVLFLYACILQGRVGESEVLESEVLDGPDSMGIMCFFFLKRKEEQNNLLSCLIC